MTVKAALIASGESLFRIHYLGKPLGRLHEVMKVYERYLEEGIEIRSWSKPPATSSRW